VESKSATLGQHTSINIARNWSSTYSTPALIQLTYISASMQITLLSVAGNVS